METINQATQAIKGTIWGDSTTNNNTSGTHSEVHKSMIDDTVTESKFHGRLESDPDAEGSYQPGQQNDSTRDTTKTPQGPVSTGGKPQGANVTGDTRNTNQNPFSSSNEPNSGFGGSAGAQPSVDADPSSAQQDTRRHQGDENPTANPDTPSTTSGGSGFSGTGSTGSGNTGAGGPGGQGGQGGPGGPGAMKLPKSDGESKGEGTGTLYEKSTGLAAEGGDFDATRPGAAREAARLMDEKGIGHGGKDLQPGEDKKEKKWYGVDHSGFGGHGSHQNKRSSVSDPSSENPNPDNSTNVATHTTDDLDHDLDHDRTEKKGLSQKIKEKLHHSSH